MKEFSEASRRCSRFNILQYRRGVVSKYPDIMQHMSTFTEPRARRGRGTGRLARRKGGYRQKAGGAAEDGRGLRKERSLAAGRMQMESYAARKRILNQQLVRRRGPSRGGARFSSPVRPAGRTTPARRDTRLHLSAATTLPRG
jgi:hypothetical protein